MDRMREARITQRALRAEGGVGQEDELQRLDQIFADFTCTSDFWEKAAILMLVEYLKRPLRDDDLDDARILHACIGSMECPQSVQEIAILLYEDQLLTPDENGQLPLHNVARDGSPAFMYVLAGNMSAASVRNEQGMLPLEIAVRNENTCCLGQLVEANPSALGELNLDDRLYPKVWSQLSTTDALFRAIRSRPELFLQKQSTN
jgi:ankyrin repeat protein